MISVCISYFPLSSLVQNTVLIGKNCSCHCLRQAVPSVCLVFCLMGPVECPSKGCGSGLDCGSPIIECSCAMGRTLTLEQQHTFRCICCVCLMTPLLYNKIILSNHSVIIRTNYYFLDFSLVLKWIFKA